MASAAEYEQRQSERRCDPDRRHQARIDPVPRRAQLRRQTDVLDHITLVPQAEVVPGKRLPCLDAIPLRF